MQITLPDQTLDQLAEVVMQRIAEWYPAKPTLPRMRTAAEAARQLREEDPDTAITEYYIKSLMDDGILCPTYAGKKALINYDDLLQYLSKNKTSATQKEKQTGKIRKIV